MSGKPNNFVALILTHGRPDRVRTYDSLRRCGYTGPIRLVVDDEDSCRADYLDTFGDEVVIFSKKEIAKTFDSGDNFSDMRAIIYARNASFEIAKQLGFQYFIQLDDDYVGFDHRFNDLFRFIPPMVKTRSLDKVFQSLVKFLLTTGAASVAMAQGGDFIGGANGSNPYAKSVQLLRKCMNSFVCSTEKPFKFFGRINEDVNLYTRAASVGQLFLTTNQVALRQTQTQKNAGGMTEAYLSSGTYVKSFYPVMYHPSSVVIKTLNSNHQRLHHSVQWRNTVPKIISEQHRKG